MNIDPFSFTHWGPLAMAVGAILVYSVRKCLHAARGRNWPAVSGTVGGTFRTKVGHARAVEITYIYRVDDNVYSGQVDRIIRGSYDAAEEVLYKERQILVRYDPIDPTRSVIFDEDQLQDVRDLVR